VDGILEKKVHAILKTFPPNTILLIAVSGGADSMALFCSCLTLLENDKIFILHVDHGLRGEESRSDAEFVSSFCKERNIPCTVVSIPQGEVADFAKRRGTGIEAAARFFRRRALLREAKRLEREKGKTLILTAHTKDDTLELSIIRLLRGAGPAGLSGMPVKKGKFVRPLLEVTRTEVISYLKDKNIQWREDSTNKDDIFLRNKIRHHLIPFLDKNFPSWKKGLTGMAETQLLAAEFLCNEVKNRVIWDPGLGNSLITEEAVFFAQPQIIREEAVFQGINLLSSSRNVRRIVVRHFCLGEINACDLGPARISKKNGKITLTPAKNDYFESGVSRLIMKTN
jgi:tRNA(Ile)-lysidine synthase